MKQLLTILFIITSVNLYAKSTLICNSHNDIEGWDSSPTNEKVHFSAYIASETEIDKAIIKGAYKTDMRDLVVHKTSNDSKYKRIRFGVLEDAWCWFNILLPKNFAHRTRNFAGSIQYTCEGAQHTYQYIDMDCFIID